MELEYAPSRFKLLHKIGEGVHGVVVKAIDLECDNRLVAIKRVALRNKYGSIATNTIREIKSLQQCDNENVSMRGMKNYVAGIPLRDSGSGLIKS